MTATIHALLARHLGLEVSSIGASAVRAAIAERAQARRVELDEYTLLVDEDRTELAALVDAIVVPESWFFRDRVPFQHLAAHAVKVARKGKRLRVLSAPCSTGEEPYSVAITLLEAGIAAGAVTIDAIDVSPPLLAAAREGVYRANSFRGVPERVRADYFTPHGDGWQISDDVRRMVTFRTANLVARDFLAGEAPYDVILCRNLLIYLTADARRTALGRLSALLADGGVLIVGHAEALEVIDPRFKGVGVPGSFAYALRGGADEPPTEPLRPPPATPRRRAADRVPVAIREERSTQPSSPVVKEPADLLAEATALADRGALAEAAALADQHLARAGADARGWALLGTIEQARGNELRAEECFSRAVYCDPQHYTSLVNLALLLEKRGETRGAANLRARAERVKAGARGGR